MRKLDVVVGRDIAKDAHDFPANLWSVTLLYIALPLIVFPVRSWQYFEIFENVHIGVLPDVLNQRIAHRSRVNCTILLLIGSGIAVGGPLLGLHSSSEGSAGSSWDPRALNLLN